MWGAVEGPFAALSPPAALWITSLEGLSILPLPRRPAARLSTGDPLEAHLPAQRPTPQAQARFPRAHVDARRAGDPEAAPRQGPQAALRLSPPSILAPCSAGTACPARGTSMPSTAAAARPRRASSSSTGFRARRTTPTSRGSAWRCRSRSGTRSSGTGSSASCGRRGASWPDRARPGHDYVLVARPGLAEPADTRGRLARRARDRGPGQGGRVKYLGIQRPGAAAHFGPHAAEHLQVPPECSQYALDALRKHGLVRGTAKAAGACSAATRGATAESIRRDRRRHPHPARGPAHVGAHAPARHVGLTWAWSIVASS